MSLQMASTSVDINEGCTCKVRLLNPVPTAMSIKQDAVIGKADPINGKPVVKANQENEVEKESYTRVRRVKLVAEEMPESMSATVSRSVSESENSEVPEHLSTLYNKTAAGLGDHEKDRVARLLCKFSDIFSRDEWDLGLTHLTSHAIKTVGAAPDKQSPRRLPLANAANEKKAIEDLKAKGVIRESVLP